MSATLCNSLVVNRCPFQGLHTWTRLLLTHSQQATALAIVSFQSMLKLQSSRTDAAGRVTLNGKENLTMLHDLECVLNRC